MQDVLFLIFQMVYALTNEASGRLGAFAALATTSSAISETVLQLLWKKLSSVEPLIYLLPKHLIQELRHSNGALELRFHKTPKQSDLARFHLYAQRVKAICADRKALSSQYKHVFQTLLTMHSQLTSLTLVIIPGSSIMKETGSIPDHHIRTEVLNIHVESDPRPSNDTDSISTNTGFPALISLLSNHHITCQGLSITIHQEYCSADVILDFFNTFTSLASIDDDNDDGFLAWEDLAGFRLKMPWDEDFFVLDEDSLQIPRNGLTALHRLVYLTALELEDLGTCRIDDDALLNLALRLPYLQRLLLGTKPFWEELPRATLWGISLVLHHCPHMETLGLLFCCTLGNHKIESADTNNLITTLHVGFSPPHSPFTVAAFFAHSLPNLDIIVVEPRESHRKYGSSRTDLTLPDQDIRIQEWSRILELTKEFNQVFEVIADHDLTAPSYFIINYLNRLILSTLPLHPCHNSMAVNHYFHLQHFDKWWHDSSPTHLNLSAIPSYHLGKFIPDTRAYELLHNHELIVMIPAHYKNGLRFLNHIIICLQELLQHLGPSYHWDIIQLKYEAFGRELLWMSPIMDSFLAYMYYCGSVNPHHKSHMMSVALDDPQTYNWHRWADKQEIPGLWGRLPEHSAEYHTIMFEATRAKIALEPTTESSGECSEMWCKGIINMMVQIRQEIKDRSAASKSEQEMPKSSVDVVENDVYDKAVKKGRGHPKGVLNGTVIELQSLPRSPIKLCSQNSSGPSSLSLHDEIILMPEVIEETREGIQVPKLQTVHKKVAALDHRNLKLDQSPLNQTSLKESGKSQNKNIQTPAENDVPALDLSTLFFKKLQPNSNKSLLRLAPAKRLSAVLNQESSNQEQMQSDIAETSLAMKSQSDQHAPSQSSNTFASSDDPPSFSDYTEPWDYSSDIHMVSNEESESSLHQEVADQVMDTNISYENTLLSKPTFSSEALKNVRFSSPTVSLNCPEEFGHPTSTPSGSSPLSEDDFQGQATSSPFLPIMEYEQSPSIPSSSPSVSDQEESAQSLAITSKTSKGTLIFTKSLDDRFDYDSVTFVPNALKGKSKSKGKGKGKGKSNPQSESAPSFQKNLEIPRRMIKVKGWMKEKEKGKKKEVISDESLTDHSGSGTKSMTTLTLPANMSKVAKACQKAQASSKPESLMWNEKKQVKTHMHEIVQQRETVKLPEESRMGFKVLFTLLEMKS
ncbi:hypothetical protein F4604DRAFT_1694189 [Suillus subluteus]|nr:hypothetical protein F4604DRAFT_1694189 [Suillus subluteus]